MAQSNWFNQNKNRSFPFIKGTVGVRIPESGPVTMNQLPHDFIADAGFITGVESYFDVEEHTIYLYRVSRAGDTVLFEFRSDAPVLYDYPMVFTRDIDDAEYSVEHVEVSVEGSQSSESDSGEDYCEEPLWSGYLVTGEMESIAARLADGEEIVRETGDAEVEPALIQNIHATILAAIDLANADRTRATASDGCDDPIWSYPTGVIYPGEKCVQGDVKIKPGYNTKLLQDDLANSITILAKKGQGAGEPCEEVPVFEGETPPEGASNDLLAGGLLCNEVVRSINGVGGPLFQITAGLGVSVVAEPENNKVIVDVNMIGLAVCLFDLSQVSESLSE